MTGTGTSSIPRSSADPRGRLVGWVQLLLLAGSAVALLLLYHKLGVTDVGYDPDRATTSVFVWLGERWYGDFHFTGYAYSHYIPLLALGLIWLRRRSLAAEPRRASAVGFAFVLLALFLHWVGMKAEQTRLSLLSLILMSWAVPYFLYGPGVARRLLFPCALLVLALPLNFFDSLTYPLRTFTAAASGALLRGLGLPVEALGSRILVRPSAPAPGTGPEGWTESGFVFDVADSSSSIFALGLLLTLALLVAALAGRGGLRRALLVGSVPLLFVASHIARATLIVLAGHGVGIELGAAAWSIVSALLLLPLWALLLWLLHRALYADYAARLRALLAAHAAPPPRNW